MTVICKFRLTCSDAKAHNCYHAFEHDHTDVCDSHCDWNPTAPMCEHVTYVTIHDERKFNGFNAVNQLCIPIGFEIPL